MKKEFFLNREKISDLQNKRHAHQKENKMAFYIYIVTNIRNDMEINTIFKKKISIGNINKNCNFNTKE